MPLILQLEWLCPQAWVHWSSSHSSSCHRQGILLAWV